MSPPDVLVLENVSVLLTAIRNASAGTGEVRQALWSAKFGISARDLTRLISSCKGPKDWKKALEILEVARNGNQARIDVVKPNFFTYSAAISVCCKSRRLDEGMGLLEDMKSAGLEDQSLMPDTVIYRMLMSCCAKEGRMDQVLELHADMQGLEVVADRQTLMAVLGALIVKREWVSAVEILDKIHEDGEALPVTWYNDFIAGCAQDCNLSISIEVFLMMQMMLVEPNACTFYHLMQAIELAQYPVMGIDLIRQMLDAGAALYMGTYASLVRAIVNLEQFELLPEVTILILQHDGRSWGELDREI